LNINGFENKSKNKQLHQQSKFSTMKKFLFAMVAGFIPALAAINGAYAQNSVNTELPEPQKNVIATEKAESAGDHIGNLVTVSPRVLRAFTKSYKNVYGESWEKNNGGFSAKFTSNGIACLVYYSPNGKWQGSLKSYAEDKMPTEIRKTVKSEYYDYSITLVQEVETPESEQVPTFIVHLEDKTSIKQLRIHDGEMEVWKDLKKQ
jgi:hypothetical protein